MKPWRSYVQLRRRRLKKENYELLHLHVRKEAESAILEKAGSCKRGNVLRYAGGNTKSRTKKQGQKVEHCSVYEFSISIDDWPWY